MFESTQAIWKRCTLARSVEVARDFAILVPSTNFHPALDYPHSRVGLRKREVCSRIG